MANGGWYGTKEEWDHIEAPLKLFDPILERFAENHRLAVTRNLKDWPERSLLWGADVRCLIQLYLVDQTSLTVNLWICAHQDRAQGRYWKNEMLRGAVQASGLATQLPELLEDAKRKLDDWSARPDELTFATNLAQGWKR